MTMVNCIVCGSLWHTSATVNLGRLRRAPICVFCILDMLGEIVKYRYDEPEDKDIFNLFHDLEDKIRKREE